MKVTKSQLNGWIKKSIYEALTEEDIKDKTIKFKDTDGNEKEATVGGILKKGENHPAYKDAQALMDTGDSDDKGSSTNINIDADPFGDPSDSSDDVGGPAHPNVPKKKKAPEAGSKELPLSKWADDKKEKPGAMNDLDWDEEIEPHDLEGWIQDNIKKIPPALKTNVNKLVDRYEELYSEEDYDTAAVVQKKLENELTKYMGGSDSKKQSPVDEKVSPSKATIKEVRVWMKKLEENRYKKIVHADCRRVAWFVNNNLAENYEEMPKSIRKKWSKAQYGRERYLAKEFLNYKSDMHIENKLREEIRYHIKSTVN